MSRTQALRGSSSTPMSPSGGTPRSGGLGGSLSPTTPMGGFGSSARERVKVHVRLRPHNANDERRNEHGTGEGIQVLSDGEIQVTRGVGDVKKFKFDSFLGPTAGQQDVFVSAAQSIIEDVISGYNGCIMCYGQTGTGKTYTLGNDVTEGMQMNEQTIGITGRALRMIFQTARNDHSCDYQVSMSYVQIYMEMIQDLLEVKNDQVQVREDPERGVFLQGAAVYRADSEAQCREIIEHGNRNRSTAFTDMNAHSSRSHAVLCVMVQRRTNPTVREVQLRDGVTSTEQDMVGVKATAGKLYCVDLAGSERAKKSGAKGTRMEELKSINMSLSALGNCISALADASTGKAAHIPFRDSRLTRLLQDSLGGNAKTSLVITVGPSAEHIGETLNSLSFGQRAMRVVMHAKVNQEVDYKTMCIQLQAELDTKDDIIHHLENRLKLAEERAMGRQPSGGADSSAGGSQNMSRAAGVPSSQFEVEKQSIQASAQADVQAAAQAMEDEVQRVMSIWKGKMENQQLQCDQRYAQMESMLTKEVESLREELGKANSRVASSKTVMDRNRTELASAQEELNKLEKEHFARLRDLLEKQEELKGKCNEKTQAVEALEAEVKSLKATLDTKVAEVTGSLMSSNQAQAELEKKMKESQGEATRLQEQVDSSKRQATDYETTIKTLRDQLADLRSQVSREAHEKATAASKAEQMVAEKEKAKDMAHQQIKDVQAQAMAAEKTVAELKLQIKHKEGEMERTSKAKEKLEAEKAEVAQQLAACRLTEEQSQQLAKTRSGEISKLDAAVKELKRKLDLQIDEHNVTKDKLAKETAKAAEIVASQDSEQSEKAKEIQKLQADFLGAHTKADELESKCAKLAEEKAELEAGAKERESKDKQKAMEKLKVDTELRESIEKLAAKDAEVSTLTARISQIESQTQMSIEGLKTELDAKAEQLAKKTQELISLNEESMLLRSSTELELEQAHEEGAAAKVEVLSLQQKVESLSQSMSSLRDSETATSDQIQVLETTLKERCKALEAVEEKHQGTVAETGQRIGELESKVSELEAEVAAKESSLQAKEAANTEAGNAVSEAQATIAQHVTTISSLEQRIAGLEKANTEAASSSESTIASHLSQIAELQQQEREMSDKLQDFDSQVAKLKSQLKQVSAEYADSSAHLETSQHMYKDAQADLAHLNEKYKRAKHLLSQRHWRGAGNAVYAFFRNMQSKGKLSCFQKWKELLQVRAIAGYRERELDHHRNMEHEAAKRAKLKKQALSVQKQNQTIRSEQARLEQQENAAQVAAGKALIRNSVEKLESFFSKVGTFFLDENAKSYAQYKAENPGR